jgi:Clp amino terminal domain, pathogenicity island component/UvrB/uvrC motif
MFQRFTDQARRVVTLAQEEARMLRHNRVGTEHILLGLIQVDDGIASASLEALGISLAAVRQQVEEIIGTGRWAPPVNIPYAPQAKRVLDMSLREALALGHHTIGTEHILLGLIREGESPAARVLASLGAELGLVRQQVLELLQDTSDEEPASAPPGVTADAGERGLLSEAIARFGSIDSRLSAVEQRVGTGPDVGDLDQQIAHARREKESAARAEDYETAAALRDRERMLLAEKASRQQEWATAQLDLPSLAEGLNRLSGEVERLRRLLIKQGIEPKDGAA